MTGDGALRGALRDEKGTLDGAADGRCFCTRCTDRTEDIYRMVGSCRNCGARLLMVYRAGDKSGDLDCPLCGVWRSVHALRLATADEVPVAGGA